MFSKSMKLKQVKRSSVISRESMESGMESLRQNDYLCKETFEEFLNKTSRRGAGKKVFFTKQSAEKKNELYRDYLKSVNETKVDKEMEKKVVLMHEKMLQD